LVGFCLAVTASPLSYSYGEDAPEALPDADRIQKDLMGRSLAGWEFEKGTLCRIAILRADCGHERAVVKASIKTVKHIHRKPGWIGKEGELKLVYGHDKGGWVLMDIEATALSDMGADDVYSVRKTDGRPLLIAADEGDVERVKELLKGGANVYQRARGGETALMIAASQGHLPVSEVLIKEGLDVDMISAHGLTALMMAASAHQTKMVAFLLKNGADPNCKGPLGCTALLLALEKRQCPDKAVKDDVVSTARVLVDQGADVNAKDKRGCTPLWLALMRGEADVVRLLVEKGADVNLAAGPSDQPPLMTAVAMGRPSMVKTLVEKGADVHATRDGVTALDMAKAGPQRCNTKMALIGILEDAGAQ
jgi:ankyrin repeat protein